MFISYILCHPTLSPDNHGSSSAALWRQWSFNKYNSGKWEKLNPKTDLWKSYNSEEKIHLQMSQQLFFFFALNLCSCAQNFCFITYTLKKHALRNTNLKHHVIISSREIHSKT